MTTHEMTTWDWCFLHAVQGILAGRVSSGMSKSEIIEEAKQLAEKMEETIFARNNAFVPQDDNN